MSALLDTSAAGATKLAARAIDRNLIYTDRHVWAWFRLPLRHLEYLTFGEQESVAFGSAAVWNGLQGHEVHLLTAAVPADPDGWAAAAAEAAYRQHGDWHAWMADAVAHLHRRGDLAKAVYVGVRLGDRRTPLLGHKLGALLGQLELVAGVADPMVDSAELARWRTAAEKIGRPLTEGHMEAVPATADELAWLIADSVKRSHRTVVPQGTRRWGPGQLAWLVDGELTSDRTCVRAEGPDGQITYHATLAVARMPEVLTWPPGPPWLCLHEWSHERVAVSARWQIVDHTKARKDVANRNAAARDQADHVAKAGGSIPGRDRARLQMAAELEERLERDRTPLIYAHTRLLCTADSPEQLDSVVDEVTEHYRQADIALARPSYDQLQLHMEAAPGDRVRVTAYRQVHDPEVLGVALPHASGGLGDGRGPYIGYTLGTLSQQPVHYSTHEAVNRDDQRETTVAVVGSLGGGKTVTTSALCAAGWRKGYRVIAFDPKGDLARLAELPGADVDVIDLTTAPAGILDPWSLFPNDPDGAKMVALETLERLVGWRTDREAQTEMARAVNAESQGSDPSLAGVLERLAAAGGAAEGISAALDLYRSLPLARLAFQRPTSDVRLTGSMTIITTPGVEYPPAGTPLAEMSWPQRLAVTAIYLVGAYARREAMHAEAGRPKLIALDEAWALTATDQGRALITDVSRMGRSLGIALVLATQSASDLSDERVRNVIGTVFAHRIGSRGEGDAVADLLGVTRSDRLTNHLLRLGKGETIMRDLDWRVGRMQVDVMWDQALRGMLDSSRKQARADAAAAADNLEELAV